MQVVFSKVVGVRGVEPRTLRLSSACSNQLSYTPVPSAEFRMWSVEFCSHSALHTPHSALELVELRRLELLTYSLQSYRSTN